MLRCSVASQVSKRGCKMRRHSSRSPVSLYCPGHGRHRPGSAIPPRSSRRSRIWKAREFVHVRRDKRAPKFITRASRAAAVGFTGAESGTNVFGISISPTAGSIAGHTTEAPPSSTLTLLGVASDATLSFVARRSPRPTARSRHQRGSRRTLLPSRTNSAGGPNEVIL